VGFLIHTLLHFVVGASLVYLICNKEFESKFKRSLLILFGGIAGVSPDVTKFFGDILGHSILITPVIGLLFAIGYYVLQKEVSFKKAWLMFSVSVLSHLIIDYIGNGVAFVYPFTQKEFDFSIVSRNDAIILYTLFIALIIGMFFRKGKVVVLAGILVVSLYLGGLSFSKIQLQQALERQYQSENIDLLLTFPRHNSQWGFIISTDEAIISGYSPILGIEIHIEQETKKQ
jgi:hypothetical protein